MKLNVIMLSVKYLFRVHNGHGYLKLLRFSSVSHTIFALWLDCLLSLCLTVCLSLSLCLCLFLCLRLSLSMSLSLSVCLSACLCLWICLCLCLYLCQLCVRVCLCLCLCLSVSLHIHTYTLYRDRELWITARTQYTQVKEVSCENQPPRSPSPSPRLGH